MPIENRAEIVAQVDTKGMPKEQAHQAIDAAVGAFNFASGQEPGFEHQTCDSPNHIPVREPRVEGRDIWRREHSMGASGE